MKLNLTPLVPAVAVFNMFSNALMLTGPLFLLQVYERVLASRPEETLVDLFALMVGLFCPFALFEHSRRRVMAHVGAKIQSELSGEVFQFLIQKAALKQTGTPGLVRNLDKVRTFLGRSCGSGCYRLGCGCDTEERISLGSWHAGCCLDPV